MDILIGTGSLVVLLTDPSPTKCLSKMKSVKVPVSSEICNSLRNFYYLS